MNVVFIGASAFGSRCFHALEDLPDVTLTAVVTAPRRFAISYSPSGVENVLHADIAAEAAVRGIPVLTLPDGMKAPEALEQVAAWRPEAFVVAGWYHMVPRSWRQLAPAYGLHASLLPDYSGGAPLVWAMINGETKTGITLFRLEDGVDNGPIVAQGETEIREDDTIATLYGRIEDIGSSLVKEYMPRVADGSVELRPQQESERRVFPQRAPEDGVIDWAQSARQIYNFIRAQTKPYPGAFTIGQGRKLTVWSARVACCDRRGQAAGEILPGGDFVLVQTGDAALELLDVAVDGESVAGLDLKSRLAPGLRLGI